MHYTIENANYFRDARNRARPNDERFTVRIERDDGTTETVKLPTCFAVCPVCRGEGTHVNPSIDCNGLSSEDFADDPDFEESYLNGTYDVRCNRCEGSRVVRELDESKLTDAHSEALAALKAEDDHQNESYAEQLAEIRCGC